MAEEIRIPRLGWSMEEGTFAGWLKKPGDTVRPNEPLFTLEGEKATQEIESIGEGVLHLAPDCPRPGQVVPVGHLIGQLCAAGETPVWSATAPPPVAQEPARPKNEGMPQNAPLPPVSAGVAASPSVRRLARQMGIDLNQVTPAWPGGRVLEHDLVPGTPATANSHGRLIATPRARRIARERGLDLRQVRGAGPGGRIRERDLPTGLAPAAPPAEIPDNAIPVTTRRRTIAKAMVKSRQETVPVTLTTRADATALLALRARLKRETPKAEIAPTFNDMLLKLIADLLVEHPMLGSRWEETYIVPPGDTIDLGLAVDAPTGLVVPVVRDVRRRSLAEIAADSHALVEKGRQGRLAAEEMRGALFTLTSLGPYGVEFFNPVIPWPQVAILGLGTIKPQPVPLPSGQDGFTFRKELPLSLTFDHRVVDGAPAARFLRDLVERVEVIG
jgi:pyruvate dehydrogenase E2 component (dihydrolipoamide acetyltransferase)